MPEIIPNPQNPQVAPGSETIEPKHALFNWAIAICVIALFVLKFPALAKGALIFIITLSILVFVHEWGHYQFARWAGMKVNRFGIGFPPWIYTKRYKGIDYSIGALPIGGMVDIAGLGSEEEMVATAKGQDLSTAPSHRHAKPDAPFGERLFQDSPLGWRFLTLFAGPMMNFIFAIVLFISLFSILGIVEKYETITTIGFVRPNTPADEAGLSVGDKIIAVNGAPINDVEHLAATIQDSDNLFSRAFLRANTHQSKAGGSARVEWGAKPITPLVLTVMRDGQRLEKTITPTLQDVPILNNGRMDSMQVPAVGIEFDEVITSRRVGIGRAISEGLQNSFGMTQQIVFFLGRALTFNLTHEEVRGIGGPVKIAQAVTKSARAGFYAACVTAGMLSVNLGLMNLLPFPALDGGRILFLGYELVFRKPFDARKEGFVHMIGMAMLLVFMLFITARDILPWVTRSLKGVF